MDKCRYAVKKKPFSKKEKTRPDDPEEEAEGFFCGMCVSSRKKKPMAKEFTKPEPFTGKPDSKPEKGKSTTGQVEKKTT